MEKIKKGICIIIGYLPITARFRSHIYKAILTYDIGKNVKCKYGAIIDCDEVKIGNDSVIGCFAKIKGLSRFEMGQDSMIDNHAIIMGPQKSLWGKNKPVIKMGDNVAVMAYWVVDVCGHINFGNNVLLAGRYGQIWTHTFDLCNNRLDFELKFGNNIYIGSGCIIAGNVTICDDVVIVAGSTITEKISRSGVYSTNVNLDRVGNVHQFSELYNEGIEIKEKITRAKQYFIY